MTLRKRMAALLEEGPLSVRDLSNLLGIREREVLDHLPHIARSISRRQIIRMIPPTCALCGFVFRKRSRYGTPSKCPRCRGQRIHPPLFHIEIRRGGRRGT